MFILGETDTNSEEMECELGLGKDFATTIKETL